ncbi:MAG TPA: transposase [Solirubrobacterales bacterium]|nr:transposase [Solirubrobacterales bacterium]
MEARAGIGGFGRGNALGNRRSSAWASPTEDRPEKSRLNREEKLDGRGEKTHPARRWVVERTIAWLQKCRGILVRYDKKPENYEGLVQLACALLWFRRLKRS